MMFPLGPKVKRVVLVAVSAVIAYGIYIVISLALLPPVTGLQNRKNTLSIQVRDWKGAYHPFLLGPKNRRWTPGGSIPAEMKWAVILAEDSNFYKHSGVDMKAIKNAIKYDLEKQSMARGASTITQQVAKNVFLTREKSLTRKIKEVVLAKRMEQTLTKGRIIELYLNVVELGPMVYGIGHGAQYYFGKPAALLTPRESAFLAAMLPGPRVAYNPYKNIAKVLKRSDMILGLMRKNGVLSEAEYRQALNEMPSVAGLQRKVDETIVKVDVFQNQSSAVVLPAAETGVQAPEAKKPVEEHGTEKPGEENLPVDRQQQEAPVR